jgi:chromate transporter
MTAPPQKPSLPDALKVWAKIGILSFGGPAGQIALMHKELVEERRWIGEQRFLHALNYCMLLPGPEAQQLAVYIGWLLHRWTGGLIAGLLFVVPGALVMLGLSILYAFWRHLPLIDAVFLGVKAAVLAVVIEAVLRIGRRALKNRALLAIAALAFFAIFFLRVPFPLIVAAAGLVGWIGSRYRPSLFEPSKHAASGPDVMGVVDGMFERGELDHAKPSRARLLRALALWIPIWLAPAAILWALTGSESVWTQIAGFFSLMAAVTFGGAYAVLAYVAQAAVETFGWMTPGEMVDGLGLAETTPGPLILVTQFVGFLAALRNPGPLDPLLAACLGALLTTWVTFAPCFLWIFAGAPYVEALRGNRAVAASLSAITAAVVGVILNLAVWFAIHVLFREVRAADIGPDLPVLSSVDWRAAFLAAVAGLLLLKLKWGMLTTLGISAALGVAIWFWL